MYLHSFEHFPAIGVRVEFFVRFQVGGEFVDDFLALAITTLKFKIWLPIKTLRMNKSLCQRSHALYHIESKFNRNKNIKIEMFEICNHISNISIISKHLKVMILLHRIHTRD